MKNIQQTNWSSLKKINSGKTKAEELCQVTEIWYMTKEEGSERYNAAGFRDAEEGTQAKESGGL